MTLFAKCAEPNCNAPIRGDSDLCISHQMDAKDKKWMPEVGQECEYKYPQWRYWLRGSVNYVSEQIVVIAQETEGTEQSHSLETVMLRPVQPQADKERDEQIEQFKLRVFRGNGFSLGESKETAIAIKAIDNGVRVLQPNEFVARELGQSEILALANNFNSSLMTNYEVIESVIGEIRQQAYKG